MLKLNTSFSKKVPVAGQDYSSQSFHASVEIELADSLTPEQIQERIHQTFDLVKRSVEAELQNGNTNTQAAPPANNPQPGNGSRKASNKQIKFITDLASRKNIAIGELNAQIAKRFGVAGLYDLSSKQASELVDTLKRDKAA
jgi:hypothetical protein